MDSNRRPLMSEATALPTEAQTLHTLQSLFFYIWANPGLFMFIFVLFSSQFKYTIIEKGVDLVLEN